LIVGLSFLINSQANITGAVIGASATPSEAGFFAGASLILASFILFAVGISGLEKIIITNSINKIPAIKKRSIKSRRNQDVARELDHLIRELKRGNLSPGKGYRYLGDKLNEIKGATGARVYFLKTNEGYNIIGESSKELQTKAIDRLKHYISEGGYD